MEPTVISQNIEYSRKSIEIKNPHFQPLKKGFSPKSQKSRVLLRSPFTCEKVVFCRKRILHSISKGNYGIPYFSRGMLVIWKHIYIYVDWGWKSDFQQPLLPQSLSRPSLHSHHPRIIHAIEELGLLASKPKDWRLEKNKKIETLGARKNQIAS